jgi:bifunctional DNA-binding transcriptional regulator/antitoxin component of YhaV-PrlF toxin-antitoxin module
MQPACSEQGGKSMSKIKELHLNKDGQLTLDKDILEALRIRDGRIQCIIDADQIILRNPISVVEQLFGCWGEESEEDYD